MKISKEYMLTHDIDWFCCINGQYLCHFASNGSILPDFVADYRELRLTQQLIARLPALVREEDVLIEDGYKRELQELEGYNEHRYFESFKLFASKGFYSFDYDNLHDEIGRYRFIVGPSHPLDPYTIAEILSAGLPVVMIEDIENNNRDMLAECVNQIRNN